ncbi:hypothetical protein FOZ63_002568 [Perkinsus olseni]|uniref:NAD(P)-binding domain-containing protein n=1 Tax=Perkinsus olseni TaxID=32597 RepID=A0A7J6RT49_PEROL|nr:hypothetical protein FOZ63_002568 [Perkinsus olseni]
MGAATSTPLSEARAASASLPTNSRVAVVAGATGATGRWVVSELLNSNVVTKVVAVTRNDISDAKSVFQQVKSEEDYSKLIVAPADWKKMAEKPEDASLPERALETIKSAANGESCIAFCCLGSAPYTEESDYLAPTAFAHACKEADQSVGMSLVSAGGADPNSMIGYSKTIGRREEAFEGMKFDRLSIFRPAMLLRQDKQRMKEKIFLPMTPPKYRVDTRDVARAMVFDATHQAEEEGAKPSIYSNADIQATARVAAQE